MDEYLLIFRHQDGNKIASPEQIAHWKKQTEDWIATIAAQNNYVSGTGLPFEGARVVHHDKSVTLGAFGKSQETIGGFVTVKAHSYEAAADMAKGSPVLQGEGNTVEVRKVIRG